MYTWYLFFLFLFAFLKFIIISTSTFNTERKESTPRKGRTFSVWMIFLGLNSKYFLYNDIYYSQLFGPAMGWLLLCVPPYKKNYTQTAFNFCQLTIQWTFWILALNLLIRELFKLVQEKYLVAEIFKLWV